MFFRVCSWKICRTLVKLQQERILAAAAEQGTAPLSWWRQHEISVDIITKRQRGDKVMIKPKEKAQTLQHSCAFVTFPSLSIIHNDHHAPDDTKLGRKTESSFHQMCKNIQPDIGCQGNGTCWISKAPAGRVMEKKISWCGHKSTSAVPVCGISWRKTLLLVRHTETNSF